MHAWLLGMALAGCATAPPVEAPAPRPGASAASPTLEEAAELSAARFEAIRLLRRFIEKYPDDARTTDVVRRLLALVRDGGDPAELAATVAWLRTLPLRDAELRESPSR